MTGRNWQTCLYLAHMEHLDIVSSMSRPIPDQYMMEHAIAVHFSMPKWLSRGLVNNS